jgi:hypothetical protein
MALKAMVFSPKNNRLKPFNLVGISLTKMQKIEDVVLAAFRHTVNFLEKEIKIMPLSRWNESILRYFFCQYIATSYSDIKQFIECDHIDLVLRQESLIAFIEFKFYIHPLRFDPYSASAKGYKGGPGRKNLKEFQSCVNLLHNRRPDPNLSKYIVLVYADPIDGSRPRSKFSHQYSNYQHPDKNVLIRLFELGEQIVTDNDIIQSQLYKINNAT